ncbi:MAG: C40 family peptidase [Sphingomonadales bacterium]|nr:C40 family peptidase [Sphingomonadales bacterium]
MSSWSNSYIGTPWAPLGRSREGVDCYGLACVIYREELGITLPAYLGDYSLEDEAEIATLIAGGRRSPLWVPVEGPALAFDLALFRRGRIDAHVGIVVQRGLMIHVTADTSAHHATYLQGPLKHRFTGHYRHVDLISEGARG